MFSEVATRADAAWLGASTILALAALALAVLGCVFRKSTLAYVVAAATIGGLLITPVAVWTAASTTADRFGGGLSMIWTMVLPATRAYALFAAALTAINGAVVYAK